MIDHCIYILYVHNVIQWNLSCTQWLSCRVTCDPSTCGVKVHLKVIDQKVIKLDQPIDMYIIGHCNLLFMNFSGCKDSHMEQDKVLGQRSSKVI